jgi:enamine deaminase RidA (YjgF/YER057c/UK114 family)
VRLNYYTTDVAAYLQASGEVARRLATGAPPPAGTLLGVAELFHPDILVEIEATACGPAPGP